MKKISIIPSLLLLCLIPAGSLAQEKPPAKAEKPAEGKPAAADAKARAKQVIEAARQAKGSAEKMKAARDLTTKADATVNVQGQSIDISFASYLQAPDKTRVEINIPALGQSMIQVATGASGWMDVPGQGTMEMPAQLAATAKNNAAREWFVDFLVAPDGKEAEATALEDAQVNGKAADALAVTIGETKFTIYFDKETHLPVKTAYETLNQQMDNVKAESLYEDYKDVGGIKLAHKLTVFQAGEKFLDAKITEVKINGGIEASKFTKQ